MSKIGLFARGSKFPDSTWRAFTRHLFFFIRLCCGYFAIWRGNDSEGPRDDSHGPFCLLSHIFVLFLHFKRHEVSGSKPYVLQRGLKTTLFQRFDILAMFNWKVISRLYNISAPYLRTRRLCPKNVVWLRLTSVFWIFNEVLSRHSY